MKIVKNMEVYPFTSIFFCISSIIRQSFFSFQNNPKKNLDPSLGLFRKGKTRIIAKFHRTDSYL